MFLDPCHSTPIEKAGSMEKWGETANYRECQAWMVTFLSCKKRAVLYPSASRMLHVYDAIAFDYSNSIETLARSKGTVPALTGLQRSESIA
jgi:hypothetical protein